MEISQVFEILEKARKESEATGKRVVRKISKEAVAKALPNIAGDARAAITRSEVVFEWAPLETMTVGEWRDMCRESGTKFAQRKFYETWGLHPSTPISLLKQDVDAIREGVNILPPQEREILIPEDSQLPKKHKRHLDEVPEEVKKELVSGPEVPGHLDLPDVEGHPVFDKDEETEN